MPTSMPKKNQRISIFDIKPSEKEDKINPVCVSEENKVE